MDLLLHGIGELATPEGQASVCGLNQGQLKILSDAYVLIHQGRIAEIGEGKPPPFSGPKLDCQGHCLTPGLIDPHTHAVFAGNRVSEFLARAKGEKYTGVGILTTVNATILATENELIDLARPRLLRMLSKGAPPWKLNVRLPQKAVPYNDLRIKEIAEGNLGNL